MNKDAPDFGNPWADEDGSSGGFASSPEFENPWADASETGDATVSGTDETAATTGAGSADSPDTDSPGKKASSSAASKVSAILLAIALVIVGIWALSSNSSANKEIERLEGDVESLESTNSSLQTEADKVSELESKIRALESDASDADSLEQQRDRLLAAFGGVDPCSITGFGTASPTNWIDVPEKGFGCAYYENDKTTLVVTIGTDDADSEDTTGSNNDVEGYYLSRTDGNRTVFVWAPGSESEARQTASDVLDDLIG